MVCPVVTFRGGFNFTENRIFYDKKFTILVVSRWKDVGINCYIFLYLWCFFFRLFYRPNTATNHKLFTLCQLKWSFSKRVKYTACRFNWHGTILIKQLFIGINYIKYQNVHDIVKFTENSPTVNIVKLKTS